MGAETGESPRDAELRMVYEVTYDRARRAGSSMHEAAHQAVKARNERRLAMDAVQRALAGQPHPPAEPRVVHEFMPEGGIVRRSPRAHFAGQCPATDPETGERCAYTVHDRAPEYHSWVRLVQS